MFKIVHGGKLPTRGTKHSACVDLYANEDVVIGAGETVLVPLGVCLNIQEWFEERPTKIPLPFGGNNGMQDNLNKWKASHYLQLILHSSLSKELIISNGVGVVDMDCKDEIMIRLHNPLTLEKCLRYIQSYFTRTTLKGEVLNRVIKKGDGVAQIMLCEHKSYLFGIESEVERDGGFGSTDGKDF